MSDDPATGIDPRIALAAREKTAARFGSADISHPAVAVLFELASERLAQAAVLDPGLLEPPPRMPEISTPPPAGFTPSRRMVDDIIPPPLPRAFITLQEVLGNPQSSLRDIAAVVSHDPGLSALLLKLANSAFYGFSGRVDTIERAVSLLGAAEVNALAAGAAVSTLFRDNPHPELLDLPLFWKHSVACAIVARFLAERAGLKNPERFFLAGLLHDIGKILLAVAEPEMTAMVRDMSLRDTLPETRAEREIFSFDHGELGGRVIAKWRFPEALALAVAGHHDPLRAAGDPGPVVIHVADMVALALGLGARPDPAVPPLSPEAFASLGIFPQDMRLAAVDLDERLPPLAMAFLDGGMR
ncbi:HDOD domain-containing protein [Desulfolutivibrio sulfoxidireducens]|uniref:HDOD domain-containing protein n=1 Tax=Desulfolutivibrio sulfoxidireducens TaxID=2773299 RepID=UPI00159D2F1E|nr:HDOD domain-containing protein [Desulfolutivibrio sulfoxidireducens]QLA17534.1 HDOD domain-containing protein [Desulfolutivibrio sulfoxidireducens]QLA21120.1 HDOD domain-containing protein [Desulfolutivibrio sulfoxidireducens]